MDLISRQAAIDALENQKDKNAKGDIGGFYNTIIQHDIDAIAELPSVQPERKKGKWHLTDAYPHWLYCNQCYKKMLPNAEWVELYNIPTNFCPNCGCEMEMGK